MKRLRDVSPCKLFLWFWRLQVMLFLSVAWQQTGEKIVEVMSEGEPEGDGKGEERERGKRKGRDGGREGVESW